MFHGGGEVCALICELELRHVPYEADGKRVRFFSLVRRRIHGGPIYMYKIEHDLLDFPWDVVFAAPASYGLRGHGFKVHQQRYNTRLRQQEEIVNASKVEVFNVRLGEQ